jgi:hypothetical protein
MQLLIVHTITDDDPNGPWPPFEDGFLGGRQPRRQPHTVAQNFEDR